MALLWLGIRCFKSQGSKQHTSPEKPAGQEMALPGEGPAENGSHAWAKQTAVLAKIPRSFLPCAGPDLSVSSQECRRMWADRNRPRGARLSAPAGPGVPCQHVCQPSCVNIEFPGKAGEGETERAPHPTRVWEETVFLTSFLWCFLSPPPSWPERRLKAPSDHHEPCLKMYPVLC